MPLTILVSNQPPDTDANVDQPLLELFRAYAGQECVPFQHQAEVFRLIAEGQEVFLVAGTAAGKTLAIAVPLFEKLRTGCIRKVLFMYPTIALMEDQRRVMDSLAQITGLEIGQLQGGLSRTELMAALNKPVILATPDEVYWFFRKNVKYSGLLIYGLALVDEVMAIRKAFLEESKEAIRKELKAACGYELNLANLKGAMDHIWAFVVTHHGLFHLSYEREGTGVIRPLTRRQWTSFYPNEERRTTLVDLLFEYHPLGGMVIIADLVASYCHEQGKDYAALFGRVATVKQLLDTLIERAPEIEDSLQRYDPRDYSLRETLCLLAGAIR